MTTRIFPSLLPQDQRLDRDELRDLFDDDYNVIRQAPVVARDNGANDLPVNGRSDRPMIESWIMQNYTKEDAAFLAEKCKERLDE